MRDLIRNQRTIYYSLREGYEQEKDEAEYLTGDTAEKFTDPEELLINVSTQKGEDFPSAFGPFVDYDIKLTTADTSCPLVEGSLVWFEAGIDEPNNYVVVRRSSSKNALSYALKRVSNS